MHDPHLKAYCKSILLKGTVLNHHWVICFANNILIELRCILCELPNADRCVGLPDAVQGHAQDMDNLYIWDDYVMSILFICMFNMDILQIQWIGCTFWIFMLSSRYFTTRILRYALC